MPRIFINLEAGCLQVNLMSTSAQINQLKYTILLYYTIDIADETKQTIDIADKRRQVRSLFNTLR